MAEKKTHKYKFKAEVNQLLDILTHSLYTNREIFLRELISNASDALEKVRFETLKGSEVHQKEAELEIKIGIDKDNKILTITDTGIGMTQEELVKNIGTIAKSGTADFLKQVSKDEKESDNIIGKFGVGFYSVFMVADEVTILSRSFRPDAKAVEWKSKGVNDFQIIELEDDLPRGTQIKIHLKEDAVEFMENYKLEGAIKTHSNFVAFPIRIDKKQVNTIRAIWREPKFQLKDKDYNEFYKFLTYDQDEPLDKLHISVDAPVQFNSLLFIPKKNYDLFGTDREGHGLDLYVKRVLIQHENKDVLPEYLRFFRGVVDSEDIPLNISRETLQENLVIGKIKQNLTGQILTFLGKMAKDDPKKYAEFWKEHGKFLKMGHNDYGNQEKIGALYRFNSSIHDDAEGLASLEEYIGRAKTDQKEIYYITLPGREAIRNNPHLEIFRKKGVEVLYLYDPIDEFALEGIRKFKDFELMSVEKADLAKFDNFVDVEESKKTKKLNKDDEKSFDKLLRRMKDILGDRVEDVIESRRLTDSPSCLVSPEGEMSSSMQRIMRLMNKDTSIPKKKMEVNKDHPLVRNMLSMYKKDAKDPFLQQITEQMFEADLLLEGYLNDPHQTVNRLQEILTKSTGWYLEK